MWLTKKLYHYWNRQNQLMGKISKCSSKSKKDLTKKIIQIKAPQAHSLFLLYADILIIDYGRMESNLL